MDAAVVLRWYGNLYFVYAHPVRAHVHNLYRNVRLQVRINTTQKCRWRERLQVTQKRCLCAS